MRILLVKNSIIPPVTYGGTQRIVDWLAHDLLALGHEVWVAAKPESGIFNNSKIKHFACPQNGDYSDIIPAAIDIVHFHEIPRKLPTKTSYLYTEHGNQTQYKKLPNNTVFLSQSHAQNHAGKYFVYNGIPATEYTFQTHKHDRLLFMAMVNWRVKNALLALTLARQAKMPLDLTGGYLSSAWKIWGSALLKHYVQGQPWVTQHGSVGGNVKKQLLAQASILFYIVKWSEPFALAPQEALASGTPILAAPNGALAEYIDNNVNGYLVHDKAEALHTLNKHRQLSPGRRSEMAQDCLNSLHQVRQMTKGYLHFYEHIIKNQRLYPASEQPIFRFTKPAIKRIDA